MVFLTKDLFPSLAGIPARANSTPWRRFCKTYSGAQPICTVNSFWRKPLTQPFWSGSVPVGPWRKVGANSPSTACLKLSAENTEVAPIIVKLMKPRRNLAAKKVPTTKSNLAAMHPETVNAQIPTWYAESNCGPAPPAHQTTLFKRMKKKLNWIWKWYWYEWYIEDFSNDAA